MRPHGPRSAVGNRHLRVRVNNDIEVRLDPGRPSRRLFQAPEGSLVLRIELNAALRSSAFDRLGAPRADLQSNTRIPQNLEQFVYADVSHSSLFLSRTL